MKLSALSLLLLPFCMCSAPQKNAADQSLLWKISGKELKSPSYLFGTIHLICKEHLVWSDAMKNALAHTTQMYLELPMADDGFQLQMMKNIMLPDSAALKDYFSPDEYTKLEQYFKDSIKTPLSIFSKMKPFGLMSFTLLKLVDCGGKMPVACENKLMEEAQKNKIPVKGLETIEAQMSIFDNMPKDRLAKMILSSIENSKESKAQYQRLVQAYLAQDLDRLLKETIASPEYAAILDELLFERNARWVPIILQAAKETPTFFAVGAAHLPGSQGVIALLQKQGYTVAPVW